MSGGSLNYLYLQEPRDLLDAENLEHLEEVEQYLLAKGYIDIARDVRRLIEYTLSAENRIAVLQDQLKDVFRSVEWRMSGDFADDTLVAHLDAYRGPKKEAEQ